MTDLAEAYFRLAIRLERADRDAFEVYLSELANQSAVGLFNQKTEITISVQDGTIKGWAKVLGRICVAVAAYGSFRSGIDYLVQDGYKFSHAVLTAVSQTGISKDEILRAERRTGVPGRLQRALQETDGLRLRRTQISNSEYEQNLSELRRNIGLALAHSTDPTDKTLIIENMPEEITETLPLRLPPPSGKIEQRALLRPEEFEKIEQLLIEPRARRDIAKIKPPPRGAKAQKRATETLYHVRRTVDGIQLVRQRKPPDQ